MGRSLDASDERVISEPRALQLASLCRFGVGTRPPLHREGPSRADCCTRRLPLSWRSLLVARSAPLRARETEASRASSPEGEAGLPARRRSRPAAAGGGVVAAASRTEPHISGRLRTQELGAGRCRVRGSIGDATCYRVSALLYSGGALRVGP